MKMTPTVFFKLLIDGYLERYPDRTTHSINALEYHRNGYTKRDTGICYNVATLAVKWCGGELGVVMIPQSDGDVPRHCILIHRGRYYDSYNPDGVNSYHELRWAELHPQDYLAGPEWVERLHTNYFHEISSYCLDLDELLSSEY